MTDMHYRDLLAVADRYRMLSQENYDRIRMIAEELRAGFCAYLGAEGPPCVLLAPPSGPFEPRDYGDQAFSVPPKGFRPLGPISFGFAVRVSEPGDWLRLVLTCQKEGEFFSVRIAGGGAYTFELPLSKQNPREFYDMLKAHLIGWFERSVSEYEHGAYGERAIGFDFFEAETDA